jgi:hypothetical protein
LESNVDPPVSETQRVVLLLNELIPQLSPPDAEVISRSYSFTADKFSTSPPSSPPAVSTKITVKIKDVAAATYLVRVQVDGAESLLGPESGQYSAPSITIP